MSDFWEIEGGILPVGHVDICIQGHTHMHTHIWSISNNRTARFGALWREENMVDTVYFYYYNSLIFLSSPRYGS
jgi:hypothetical protein